MVELEGQPDPSPDRDDDDEIVAEGASVVHGELPQDESGPPEVNSDVEVLLEKVTKQIIKEGRGQKPSKYSTCLLHSMLKDMIALCQTAKNYFSTWERMCNDEHLREAFSYFDKNNHSHVEPDEPRDALMEDGVDVCTDLAIDIFQEVDTDKDGLISYVEFVAMMKTGTGWRKASHH